MSFVHLVDVDFLNWTGGGIHEDEVKEGICYNLAASERNGGNKHASFFSFRFRKQSIFFLSNEPWILLPSNAYLSHLTRQKQI